MAPISLYFGWVSSVTYVSVLSIYALAIGHFSSWQAARVEVRQDEIEADRTDELKDMVKEIKK